jgi:hypothetical protein
VALLLVKVSDGSYSILSSSAVNCEAPAKRISGTISGSLLLDKNTEYMFIFSSSNDDGTLVAPCSRAYEHREPLAYNISVYTYEADWNCSEYSTCDAGIMWRKCNDLNHIATDKTEFASCFEFADQTINLGFDDYYTMDTFYCYGSGFPFYTVTTNTRSRLYPTGWNIPNWTRASPYSSGYLYDMITLSTEKYYADANTVNPVSLKMWYIPRKYWLPSYNVSGTGLINCNETNQGRLPETWYNGINSTFFISRNFTALTPYMGLSYRDVKCDSTELQGTTDDLTAYFTNITGRPYGCPTAPVFGGYEDYYTANGCPTAPPSGLITQIIDLTANTSKSIVECDPVISPQCPAENSITAYSFDDDSSYREYAIENMLINHTYEIRFAMNPINGLDDLYPYCIYIDDVNIVFRSSAPSCNINNCFDDYNDDGVPDYSYVVTTPVSGGCKINVQEMYPSCVPSTIRQEIEDIVAGTADNNYTCFPDDTMAIYDAATNDWDFIENNAICIAEREAREVEAGSSSVQTGTAMVVAVGNLFATPAFLAIIIAGLVSALIIRYTNAWQFGVITFLGILGVLSFLPVLPQGGTLFPAWFWVILLVLSGAIYAAFFGKTTTGGG